MCCHHAKWILSNPGSCLVMSKFFKRCFVFFFSNHYMTSRWANQVGFRGSQALGRTGFVLRYNRRCWTQRAKTSYAMWPSSWMISMMARLRLAGRVDLEKGWLEKGAFFSQVYMDGLHLSDFPNLPKIFCVFGHMILWPFDQKETWRSSNYFGRVWCFFLVQC